MYMHRFRYLLGLGIVLFLLPFVSAQASPSVQETSPRSPDLIRELYDGNPSRHHDLQPRSVETPHSDRLLNMASPPSWSRLAFQSFRNDNWDIYLVNPDGSSETRLTSDGSVEVYPALKAGCEQVLFISDRNGNYEIYSINVDGSNLLRLTYEAADDMMPLWSPDGTRVIFQSYRTGNSEVFVMNADGSNVRQLTHSGAYDGHPRWSPDSMQIVFSSDRTGRYELWMMNADGSNLHQLTHNATAFYPAWSPTGEKIAYANDGDGDGWLEIWQINPDGSASERLYGDDYHMDRWGPTWSPDGEWLAYIETSWSQHQGQWYWTYSYMRLREISTGNQSSPVSDDRVWNTHWASTDISPPGSCTVNVSAQEKSSPFIVSWSAEDIGFSGIDTFDVQARSQASSWYSFLLATPKSASIYQGQEGEQIEFRCRARDIAGNVSEWTGAPVFSTTVEAEGPQSYVSAPRCVRAPGNAHLQWHGYDIGSGIASYDVFVREESNGDWWLWQDNVINTTGVFTGAVGHTYHFRSQARDLVGHTEPWQPVPHTSVSFYSRLISGTVTDNRGRPPVDLTLNLSPDALYIDTDSLNNFSAYLAETGVYTLAVSADGYGGLPATKLDIVEDILFNPVLPPLDDVIENGGFETGALTGWSVGGNSAQVGTTSRHTGNYGLNLASPQTGTLVLPYTVRQTAFISNTLHEPILSFMYNIPQDLGSGDFLVQVTGVTTTTTLSTGMATAGWTHTWESLSAYAGQSITLTFELTGSTGSVWIDDVTVGSWQTLWTHEISPTHWYVGQQVTLTISGENFIPVPSVHLNSLELTDVTWLSSTKLSVNVPGNLAAGIYDLTVANPYGPAITVTEAIAILQHRAFLPVVLGGTGQPSMIASQKENADWPTLGYDVGHTGHNRYDPGASRYALSWVSHLPFPGGRELEQVVVADGVLVASSDSYFGEAGVVALDVENGQELWRRTLSGNYSVNPPSTAYGAVYFQKGNHGSDSYLFCLDLYTGTQYWQAPFSAQWEQYLAPLIVRDSVYVNGGYYGGMYDFNAGDGTRLWFINLPQYDKWTPAYGNGCLYSWVENRFTAHDPITGQALWDLALGWDWYGYAMDTTPVISGQTAFVVNSTGLNAIDLSSRLVRWSSDGNYYRTIPALAGDTVYALREGTLEARRITDGVLLWSFVGDGQLTNAPAIAGNYIYVASDGNTFVLDQTTHEVEWQTDHGGWLTVANGFLYVAQPDKAIYAYRAQEP